MWKLVHSPSDDGVFNGVGEGVTEVKGAGDVGRREGDDERTLRVGLTHTLSLCVCVCVCVLCVLRPLTPYSGLKNP